jgi:CHAD domain-containing protein
MKLRMNDRAAQRKKVAAGRALANVAQQELAAALTVLGDRQRNSTEAVHDIRKSMKRWRALLRLLEPFLGDDGRRLRIEARDLARSLQSAREPRSVLDALADLGEHHEALSPRSIATISARLDEMRRAGEARTLTDDARAELRMKLQATVGQIERWPLSQIDGPAIAERLGDTYGRARKAIPENWQETPAEDLHELRKRVVEHRYQMELVEPLWPKLGKAWISEAQKLRERLGSYQDLAVLAGMTVPHQPLAPWRSRLAPLIAERQERHLASATRIAGRLFAEKPKAFRRRIEALWGNVDGRD